MNNKITKIVLTGGPCAGKTTALAKIIEHFTELGFQVFAIPEVPTMFGHAGVNYLTDNKELFYEAEKATLRTQMELEDLFVRMAQKCKKPSLLVCDRGVMDISAYLAPEMWQAILEESELNIVRLRDTRYDAVLHLVTAANGAEQFYTTANNEVRSEGVEQAIALDNKLIQAWTGHPHLRIIDNEVDFEKKINNVLTEISNVLGIGLPGPIEAERKYVVEVIGEIPNSIESEIEQTYLLSEVGTEVRLRKRGWQGIYTYFQTTKKQVSATERIETERQISPVQYVSLMQQRDHSRKTIRKIRKNFVWEKQYFELDSYIEPDINLHILEIEGVTDPDAINFPPFIKVVKDVTGNYEYYNSSLAKK